MNIGSPSKAWVVLAFLTASIASGADEKLAVLKVGENVYKNVTVTSVTATDVYFSYPGGFGNAKLKNLDPELQKHFQFDPTLADEREKEQKAANSQYQVVLATTRPSAVRVVKENTAIEPPPTPVWDDPYDPQLRAQAFRGQRLPRILVEKWLTTSPNIDNKFVLLSFFETWSEGCAKWVPTFNNWQNRFGNQLVVIGLTKETEIEVWRNTKPPKIQYTLAIDTKARLAEAIALKAVPHIILIDPHGYVRYEGNPIYLTDDDMVKLLEKYAQ